MRDADVLNRARSEVRIVVTMDKDFAALAFRQRLTAPEGTVLVRIDAADPDHLSRQVSAALAREEPWRGNFVTLERDRIRIRALPTGEA